MAFIYICAMFLVSTLLTDVVRCAYENCPSFGPSEFRRCVETSGVGYNSATRLRYNLDKMKEFCRTSSASAVSGCIRGLYADCQLPERTRVSMDAKTDMIDLGLQSVCDGGIQAIMAGRECIGSNIRYIRRCVDSPINFLRLISADSPARECQVGQIVGRCVSDVVSACDQPAAAALYELEAVPNGMCSQVEDLDLTPPRF